MSYTVHVRTSAAKEIRSLPRPIQRRVGLAIDRLETTPRPPGAQALSGYENLYRLRIGEYRLVYEIRDREILIIVIRVRHRREVYRGL